MSLLVLFNQPAGGGVTISATVGDAVASGSTAGIAVNVTVSATVGNAVAAGSVAVVATNVTIAATVGNAVAAGSTAGIATNITVSATVGDAVAAGSTASITTSSGTTIDGLVGDAVAAGAIANIATNVTVAGTVGNAVAAGSTATVTTSVTVAGNVGNAVASGAQAGIALNTTISASVGNAVAAGVQAAIQTTLPTVARPSADVTPGAWLPTSGSTLYPMLDEVTPDDVDYIYTSTASACRMNLNAVADPRTSRGQVMSYRIWADTSTSLTVRLMQGATLIAAWTHNPPPLSPTTFEQALSAAECDSITDYGDLALEFEAG